MPKCCVYGFVFALLFLSVNSPARVAAQAAKMPATPAVKVSLALAKANVFVAQPAWITLSLKNISTQEIPLATDLRDYRIFVLSGGKARPKTSYYRRSTGEGLPGESELMGGGVVLSIAPGAVGIRRYNLVNFYDLSVPGTYTVYMDVQDETSGQWLRTNTVQLEVLAAAAH